MLLRLPLGSRWPATGKIAPSWTLAGNAAAIAIPTSPATNGSQRKNPNPLASSGRIQGTKRRRPWTPTNHRGNEAHELAPQHGRAAEHQHVTTHTGEEEDTKMSSPAATGALTQFS